LIDYPTDRLLAEVKSLIAEGLLRHPDIVLAKQREAAARLQAHREKMEAAEQAEFEKRAIEALMPLAGHSVT